MINSNNYIVFLLGTDDFKICKFIRKYSREHGNIDTIYSKCEEIAKIFAKYDSLRTLNFHYAGIYDNFACFVEEFYKELKDYICGNTDELKLNFKAD